MSSLSQNTWPVKIKSKLGPHLAQVSEILNIVISYALERIGEDVWRRDTVVAMPEESWARPWSLQVSFEESKELWILGQLENSTMILFRYDREGSLARLEPLGLGRSPARRVHFAGPNGILKIGRQHSTLLNLRSGFERATFHDTCSPRFPHCQWFCPISDGKHLFWIDPSTFEVVRAKLKAPLRNLHRAFTPSSSSSSSTKPQSLALRLTSTCLFAFFHFGSSSLVLRIPKVGPAWTPLLPSSSSSSLPRRPFEPNVRVRAFSQEQEQEDVSPNKFLGCTEHNLYFLAGPGSKTLLELDTRTLETTRKWPSFGPVDFSELVFWNGQMWAVSEGFLTRI